jgi:hypothetical protein
MANLTNDGEAALAALLFTGGTTIFGATLSGALVPYLGLFSAVADPEAGAFTELSGGSYARVSLAGKLTVVNGVATLNTDVTFPQATGAVGTATHFGLFFASSGGTPCMVQNIKDGDGNNISLVISNGMVYGFPSGGLNFSVA